MSRSLFTLADNFQMLIRTGGAAYPLPKTCISLKAEVAPHCRPVRGGHPADDAVRVRGVSTQPSCYGG